MSSVACMLVSSAVTPTVGSGDSDRTCDTVFPDSQRKNENILLAFHWNTLNWCWQLLKIWLRFYIISLGNWSGDSRLRVFPVWGMSCCQCFVHHKQFVQDFCLQALVSDCLEVLGLWELASQRDSGSCKRVLMKQNWPHKCFSDSDQTLGLIRVLPSKHVYCQSKRRK